MSITLHTALYQKSDETSQGVANFKTSVFPSRSFRPIARPGYGKSALSAREVALTQSASGRGGYNEVYLYTRGVVRGGTRGRDLTPPPGTVLALFRLHFGSRNPLKFYIDFLKDFGALWAPFGIDFGVIFESFWAQNSVRKSIEFSSRFRERFWELRGASKLEKYGFT